MTISPSAWIGASVYLPQSRRVAIASSDRMISFCGLVRGSYDLLGRVRMTGRLGVPHCLCVLEAEEEEYVVAGDDNGCVSLLLAEPEKEVSADQAFEVLHEHTDWVTQVRNVRDVGLVSSSLDATIRIYDVGRGRVVHSYGHHQRGVHAFEYCLAYSLFASAGVERNIVLWQAATNTRKIGDLIGHSSSVTHLALDEKSNHLISLSLDRTVKVWDLRNHKCLQTIEAEDWPKQIDGQASCLMYDKGRRRLVTCSNRVVVWPHKLVSQDKSGHQHAVREAIYNATFHVVVSADEEGTVCVWNLDNGSRQSKFCARHGAEAKLTTIAFDGNQRKLLTAADRGSLRMWNFNSGSLLREYVHGAEDLEITTALFIPEQGGGDRIIASGWSSKIFVWEDADEDTIEACKTLKGHAEDVLHMAVCVDRDVIATGDYEGRIIIWKLSTGAKRMGLFHKADRCEAAVDKLAWLLTSCPSTREERLLLLSAGGDGVLRVWHIDAKPELVTTLDGAHGRLERVSSLSKGRQHVVVGDTAGHVRVLDVSDGVDLSTRLSAKESFRQAAHWRGHEETVTGIDVVTQDDVDTLVITCSKDTEVKLWTPSGGMIGQFGADVWSLLDRTTWKDPDGQTCRSPRAEYDDILAKVGQLPDLSSTLPSTGRSARTGAGGREPGECALFPRAVASPSSQRTPFGGLSSQNLPPDAVAESEFLHSETVPMRQGDVIPLTITDLASNGSAVGRFENRVVFVPNGVPGDRLTARLVRTRRAYADGVVLELLEASPFRVKPACILAEKCGGCQWQNVGYATQLVFKQKQVEDALVRVGGFLDVEVEPVMASSPLGYRNRVIYPLRRGVDGQVKAGYYQKGTHRIVNANQCPVQYPSLDAVLQRLKAGLAPFQICSEEMEVPGLRHLAMRVGQRTGEVLITLVSSHVEVPGLSEETARWLDEFPCIVGVCLNVNPAPGNRIFGPKTMLLHGRDSVREVFCGLELKISSTAFFQVNTVVAEKMVERIGELLELEGQETIVDGYAGIGTMILPLAKQYPCTRCWAVDAHRASIDCAKHNAQTNELTNLHFRVGKFEDVFSGLSCVPDVVLLDPPRKGCDPKVLQAILERRPARVVYISCKPSTLARDLGRLCQTGMYELQRVIPVDLFPQTSHVETITLLKKSEKE